MEYARELFSADAAEFVPVCADHEHGRQAGITEDLLPAMARHLDTARVTSLIRGLTTDHDRQKVRQVVGQVFEAGKGFLEQLRPR